VEKRLKMNKFRKMIKKMINEELDNEIKRIKNRRWVAVIEMYIFAKSKEEAKIEVSEIIRRIDDVYDNNMRLIKLIPHNFGKLGQSSESSNRWLAIFDMYIYGTNENEAKKEIDTIISFIDREYDNNPSLVKLVPNEFGKINFK